MSGIDTEADSDAVEAIAAGRQGVSGINADAADVNNDITLPPALLKSIVSRGIFY